MTKMENLNKIYKKLGDHDVILDVRTREEFNEGHIPGAINIPHEEVNQHLDQLKSYQTIYIHCRSGKRAGIATETLRSAGIENIQCIDDSGMLNWIESGYELER